jgi:hypothetical protein
MNELFEEQIKKLMRKTREQLKRDAVDLGLSDYEKLRDLDDINRQYSIGFYDAIGEVLKLINNLKRR